MRTGHGIVSTSQVQTRRPAARASSTLAQVRTDHTSWMATSLLLWLCTLPVIGVLILPWLGARVALIVAAGLFVVSVTACYTICAWRAAVLRRGADDE